MYALQNDLAQLDNQVGAHFVNSSTLLPVSIDLCPQHYSVGQFNRCVSSFVFL